jgi:hypothetical protein
LRSGEDGATLPSLHLNVSSSLEDNDASPFVGTSLLIEMLGGENIDLEMPKKFERLGESR